MPVTPPSPSAPSACVKGFALPAGNPTGTRRARLLTRLVLGGALLTAGAPARADESGPDTGAAGAKLVPMLRSETLVFNGITRSRDGRLFSPFQRQDKGEGIELGEWREGKPQAYPNEAWNGWKLGEDPRHAFVGANAIRIGPDGDLWVIDKGAAGIGEPPLPGGPKLVRIDLGTNEVQRIYPLDAVTTERSFVDDFRFNGGRLYITDAGQPGLIVLDLDTGEARRVLDGHWSTRAQRPLTGENRVLRGKDGEPVTIHADQLEVSPDGKWFYYQACPGPLYRIETKYLDDRSIDDAERGRHVELFAPTVATGGTAIDASGTIYASDTDRLRILKIAPDGTTSLLVQDPRLVWVDAMWIDTDGGLWIPAAQMNRTPGLSGGSASGVQFPTTIYRLQIDAKPVRN